jgi:hypothetical protein
MTTAVFKKVDYTLDQILSGLDLGSISLPDIQRPFVWAPARVRDLFDSMYQGFPVGYFLFWANAKDHGSRTIGTDKKQKSPDILIIDGQQRLTSLYAVIRGKAILAKDYTEQHIRIAFNPIKGRFDVADAAIRQDPEFIPDISALWTSGGGEYEFITNYLVRLRASQDVTPAQQAAIATAISKLNELERYPFTALELAADLPEEKAAEVFVRINSQGIALTQSDFVLTLMSVYHEKGRRALEEFSRAARLPSKPGAVSPFNHFIEPTPAQLLRASVGLAFRRARLEHVYSMLRGKDLDSGEVSVKSRDHQFEVLDAAQADVLDLHNWHEFLRSLTTAGFRSARMISSANTIIYSYVFWLIGKRDFGMQPANLRRLIARWFFMAQTTGRYTNSPESALEYDLALLRRVPRGDADGFGRMLEAEIEAVFTHDYWAISLPTRLATSSALSPGLLAYWAALNLLDAELLFSTSKITHLLDPAITPLRSIDRHHLFPKAHLAAHGITSTSQANQNANMSFVDWHDNAAISAKAPADYWPIMSAKIDSDRLMQQMFWHGLPSGWHELPYETFLDKRRPLIAAVIRQGFERLSDDSKPLATATIAEIIVSGESRQVEFKQTARWNVVAGVADKKMEHVIVKTIGGFMNADGGTLLVGVADDGAVTGLTKDYATLGSKANRDGYELFLTQLVTTNLSGPAQSRIKITFEEVDEHDICRVSVYPASSPVFAKPQDGTKDFTDFWVRTNNSTRQYVGPDMTGYIDEHW